MVFASSFSSSNHNLLLLLCMFTIYSILFFILLLSYMYIWEASIETQSLYACILTSDSEVLFGAAFSSLVARLPLSRAEERHRSLGLPSQRTAARKHQALKMILTQLEDHREFHIVSSLFCTHIYIDACVTACRYFCRQCLLNMVWILMQLVIQYRQVPIPLSL